MLKYINNIKIKQSMFGLKMSGHLDKLVEELRQHTNEKGYFNLEIKKRKEVGKYGETHSVTVDDWKPVNCNKRKFPEFDELPDKFSGLKSPLNDLPF